MNTFEITIQRKSENNWPIVVEHSRFGELLPLRSEGTLELTAEHFQQLTSFLGQSKDYGTLLGKTLFRDDIRDTFVGAMRESEEALRMLLFIEASDRELRTLRWEKLCAPIDGGWELLALNQRVPFSFYIPAITDRRFPPIGRRDLRALVLVASPSDSQKYKLVEFDVEASVNSVKSALGEIPCDVLATIPGAIGLPTLDELCTQLSDRNKQYTILHFVSHGRVMDNGETIVYWSKADNTVDAIAATQLLERLRPLRGARGLPHFTFLCTCESASPDAEGSLGGLGQRLVRDLGMPAVVAMTDKVTIKTAQTLIENFYKQLRASGEVDSALHEATAALAKRGDLTVPALFSRLGGRPLFSDQLDRELTNAEIKYGLQSLGKLLPQRAPTLQLKFEIPAQKLENILGADVAALSKQTRQEREQALEEINNFCEEILDLSFNALALDQQPPTYDSRCPFRGLYPFRVENREFFFGREQLIVQLQQKLTEHNFLAVLGASGSGKSSVVLAGLIPMLEQLQSGVVTAYMTPSSNPIEQLQTTLSPVQGQSSILVIDQFEELFTLCTDETVRVTFIEKLLSLIPFQKIVITMRADFWGECATYGNLKDLMEARQKLIGPMDAAELRKAMEMQAAQVGLRFEPGLSNSILDDVQGEPGAMPLLQHALLEMWKRRHGRWLRAVEYEAIGGVNMAIAQTADDVYNSLSLSEQDQVKNIFIRLTRLDETALQGDKRRDTRRRVWLDELIPAGSTIALIKELVNRLAGEGARLVVTTVDSSTNREEVEVAHEALIRYWPRLLNWLDDNRTNLQLRETIRQAALEWEKQQKDDNYLVHRGGRLEDAQVLSKQAGFLNQLEADYVNACVELRLRQEQEKEARRRREIRTAWGVATGSVVAVIVSATLGVVALHKQQEAEKAKAEAISQSSLALFDSHQGLDALIEGIRAEKMLKQQNITDSIGIQGLQTAIYGVREYNRLTNHTDSVYSIAFSPDGKTIATASGDKTVKLWNLEGKELLTISGHEYVVNSVAFSPDGKTIATASNDKTVKLWNLKGKELLTISGHEYGVNSVAFSPDGKTIATASNDKTVKLWDLEGNQLHILSGHKDAVRSVAFSPDGKTIATASNDNTVKLWDLKGKEKLTISGHQDVVNSVAFSPNGQTIATASDDKTVKLWDLKGKEKLTISGHQELVNSVAFSPDGQTIATASGDKTVKLWDLEGNELLTLSGNENPVYSVAFSHDGQTIATASADNTVKLWNLEGNKLHTLSGHEDGVYSVAFSHDGQTIATASGDKTVKLWNLEGKELHTLFGHEDGVYSVTFSPNGQTIATASNDNTVKLWDLEGKELHTLSGHEYAVNSVAFSPDGQTIASVSHDNTVKLWNLAGNELHTLSGHKDVVNSVAFSPDGQTIATASADKTVKLWNLAGNELHTLSGHKDVVNSVTFSPDGQTIATASADKTVKLWNLAGNELHTLSRHEYAVYSVTFSPDGQTIATASADKTVKLWNLAGNELHTLSGHKDWVNSVVFSPDGQTIATASKDTAVIWDLKGNKLHTLSGHRNQITSLAFSPDSQILATASKDMRVILWNLNQVEVDELMVNACDWVRNYLKNNKHLEESDKGLCDSIGTN